MKAILTAAILVVTAIFPATGGGQTVDVDRQLLELAQEERRDLLLRLAAEQEQQGRTNSRWSASASVEGPRTNNHSRGSGRHYHVGLGVYGAYSPSIYRDRLWITFACFSEPGRSYTGRSSLVYVNLRLYNNNREVLDTADNPRGRINDPGICDINEGIDASFFSVSKTIRFDRWDIYITDAEKAEHGIDTGPVRYLRSEQVCSSWKRTPCLPSSDRVISIPHQYDR